MAHKGHPLCPHKSQAACSRAFQEALGRCVELTDKGKDCAKWATGPEHLCAQHFASRVNGELAQVKKNAKRAELDMRITACLDWNAEHPSVWDAMPV